MNSTSSHGRVRASLHLALFCGASLIAIAAGGGGAWAGQVVAQEEIPETVLITGSLIQGAVSVGVPVSSFRALDFAETGQLSVTDILQTIPSLDIDAQSSPTYGGGTLSFLQNVQIHSLGTGNGTEGILLVNGLRFPPQNYSNDTTNPSIIPSIAIERIDLLTAGASAVYGSDATAGVINIILRRGFDGAMTQASVTTSPSIGYLGTQFAQLYGHTWETGNITVSYTRTDTPNIRATERDYYNQDFRDHGLMDLTPRTSSLPGTVHVGNAATYNWKDPGTIVDGHPTNPVPSGFSADLGNEYCGSTSTSWPLCYSIPRGQDGVGLTWDAILSNTGGDPTLKNIINNWSYADSKPATRWNQFHFTLDQRISPNLFGFLGSTSFFMQGFYSDQRGKQVYPGGNGQARASLRRNLRVPTTNPYYPIGAPSNLRVDYALIYEVPVYITGGERAANLSAGFNFDGLPFDWTGNVTYSYTNDMNYGYADNTVNPNLLSAALGNTVTDDTGLYQSYTKPSSVPYFNVFCDPLAFTCNDPATLKYITGVRYQDEHFKIQEIGANFQGPIYQLPGGPLEAAIAFQSLNYDYDYTNLRNDTTFRSEIYDRIFQDGRRSSYAFFGQLNIPVVGPDMNIPLVENFLIELGYRYDHYDDLDNPVYVRKAAANWTIGYGFTLRGAWGESFRVPSFNEGGDRSRLAGYNPLGGYQNDTDLIILRCLNQFPGGTPGVATPGSLTAILNPTCDQNDETLYQPGAVSVELVGGGHAKILRGHGLNPMTLQQWSLGFHFTPPTGILAGLDADFSMFRLEFRGLIDNVNLSLTSGDDPLYRGQFTVIPRPDLPFNAPENQQFADLVRELTAFPTAGGFGFDPTLCSGDPIGDPNSCLDNIKVIQDAALTNLGSRVFSGIDFAVRYDRPIGDWGSINLGATGYYQILDKVRAVEGGGLDDRYEGKDSGNRLQRVRYRLGWISPASDWNVTLFAQYYGHGAVGDQAAQGNNLNGAALVPACFYQTGFGPGSCYPGSPYYGPYDVYPNQTPAVVHFDISIGYNTNEMPANEWLRNIGVQLTVVDIFDQPSPWCVCARGNGGIRANNEGFQDLQRTFTLQLTKTW